MTQGRSSIAPAKEWYDGRSIVLIAANSEGRVAHSKCGETIQQVQPGMRLSPPVISLVSPTQSRERRCSDGGEYDDFGEGRWDWSRSQLLLLSLGRQILTTGSRVGSVASGRPSEQFRNPKPATCDLRLKACFLPDTAWCTLYVHVTMYVENISHFPCSTTSFLLIHCSIIPDSWNDRSVSASCECLQM